MVHWQEMIWTPEYHIKKCDVCGASFQEGCKVVVPHIKICHKVCKPDDIMDGDYHYSNYYGSGLITLDRGTVTKTCPLFRGMLGSKFIKLKGTDEKVTEPKEKCPECGVIGRIDSSPVWGNRRRCRVCKTWIDDPDSTGEKGGE